MKNLLYAQSGDPTAAQQALSLQRQKNNFKKILYAHFGMDDRNGIPVYFNSANLKKLR